MTTQMYSLKDLALYHAATLPGLERLKKGGTIRNIFMTTYRDQVLKKTFMHVAKARPGTKIAYGLSALVTLDSEAHVELNVNVFWGVGEVGGGGMRKMKK